MTHYIKYSKLKPGETCKAYLVWKTTEGPGSTTLIVVKKKRRKPGYSDGARDTNGVIIGGERDGQEIHVSPSVLVSRCLND